MRDVSDESRLLTGFDSRSVSAIVVQQAAQAFAANDVASGLAHLWAQLVDPVVQIGAIDPMEPDGAADG